MPSKPQIADDGWTLSVCGRYEERMTRTEHVTRDGKPYTSTVYEARAAPGYKDQNSIVSDAHVAQRKHREKHSARG